MFSKLRTFLISALLLLPGFAMAQNALTNDGCLITIGEDICMTVVGDFENNDSGGDLGSIDLNGDLYVDGDFTNNSNSQLFTGTNKGNGWVILNGKSKQSIIGNAINFENLALFNANKTLQSHQSSVHDTLILATVFDLNSNTFILERPTPDAIQYLSGYIKSESQYQNKLSILQWNIGTQTETYHIPFGSGNSNFNDLNIEYQSVSPGYPNSGYMEFATYPTQTLNNTPIPAPNSDLSFDPYTIADRYWYVNANFSGTKPNSNIIFTFTQEDIDLSRNPNLRINNLKAIQYDPLINSWNYWGPKGYCNSAEMQVELVENKGAVKSEFMNSFWTLVSEEVPHDDFLIPNAFTPNADGLNDEFRVVMANDLQLQEFKMLVFDRWGNVVFNGESPQKGWNGKSCSGNKVMDGVYNYIIVYKEFNKSEVKLTGSVTLL